MTVPFSAWNRWWSGWGSSRTAGREGGRAATFTPSGTSYQGYTTAAFTVGAGTHTVTFQRLDSAGGDNTALIDAVAAAQAGAPMVGDAGFEPPSVGTTGSWGSFAYDPTGTAWSLADGARIAANGSGFTAGNPPATEWSRRPFLQETGSFSQTVTGWAIGSYALTFLEGAWGERQPRRSRWQ